MSKTKKSEAGTPKVRAKPRKENGVDKAINAFEKAIGKKNVSVGDYVRLLQLQKEIDEDEPKDVEVTWVEQSETKSSDK